MKRAIVVILSTLPALCYAQQTIPGLSKPGLSVSQALAVCQYAIKDLSVDRDAAKVPYSDDYGDKSTYLFHWNNSDPLRLPNKLGQLVIENGLCGVDKATGSINELIIGKRRIY